MSGTAPTPDLRYIVLIAEHDSGLRAALEFLLNVEGYQVQKVDSGEALLTVRLPERDACLVVDQDLPGLSGLAAIEELRRRGVELPIVLLAGHPQGLLPLLAMKARAHLVDKPLRGGVLIALIAAALTEPTPTDLRSS
jgi:two-component system response regulator FixJ